MANRFWVGGSGVWDSTNTANWAASTGGAPGASAPTAADYAYFDANSGATPTITVNAGAVATSTYFQTVGMIVNLTANVTLSGSALPLVFTHGTIKLNGFTLSCAIFSSANANVRSVEFGSGTINVTGNNATVINIFNITNFSYAGTPRFELTYAGAVGTRTIRCADNSGTATQTNTPDIYVTAGADIFRFNFNVTSTAVRTLDTTGFSGSIEASALRLFGNLNLSATTTVSASANAITFVSTQTGNTIASNGATIDRPLTFNGVGGEWKLSDTLIVGATRAVTLTNGTLDANGNNVALGSFALSSGTKTLTLGGGTWSVAGSGSAWNANTNVTNLTVSASAGTISMTSASAKTFAGGAKVWPTLNQGGAGALTIQQSNTFANITNTVQPATITLTAGTTQTVSAFGVSGTSGNLVTLDTSSAGVQATLSDSSGVNSVSFVSIKDINGIGGAIWDAPTTDGNVDAGNNTGWNFGIPFGYDIEFSPALRSFTERKHF
jgi:hypothetical protein